jgi:hypothetical protein
VGAGGGGWGAASGRVGRGEWAAKPCAELCAELAVSMSVAFHNVPKTEDRHFHECYNYDVRGKHRSARASGPASHGRSGRHPERISPSAG